MSTPENNKSNKLYETFRPAERFVDLAEVIIKQANCDSDGISNRRKSAEWRDSNQNLYLLDKDTLQHSTSPHGKWIIEHYQLCVYSPYAPGPGPVANYIVTVRNGTLDPIRRVGKDKRPIISDSETVLATKESLAILSSYAPENAESILNEKFNEQFKISIGAYILSHFAYVDNANDPIQTATTDTIIDAVTAHARRTLVIEEQEARKSALIINKDNPQTHTSVVKAIDSKPVLSDKSEVDTYEISSALLKNQNSSWEYPIVISQRKKNK